MDTINKITEGLDTLILMSREKMRRASESDEDYVSIAESIVKLERFKKSINRSVDECTKEKIAALSDKRKRKKKLCCWTHRNGTQNEAR